MVTWIVGYHTHTGAIALKISTSQKLLPLVFHITIFLDRSSVLCNFDRGFIPRSFP